MRCSTSIASSGFAPSRRGARMRSISALVPHTVSPLQRGVPDASPTPSIPSAVVTRAIRNSAPCSWPGGAVARQRGLNGTRTGNVSILAIRIVAVALDSNKTPAHRGRFVSTDSRAVVSPLRKLRIRHELGIDLPDDVRIYVALVVERRLDLAVGDQRVDVSLEKGHRV